MKLKRISIYLMLIPLLALSCNKDKTDTLDIKKYKWKLISITINSETSKPKEEKSRYVLEFLTDSTFSLNLSINSGGGKYKILKKGEIIINIWGSTKICCDNDFDKKVNSTFPQVITYTVIGNNLIFKINNDKIEFKRKW